MLDVRDLLTSATLELGELPEIDFDALARRGTRRRVGKRIGATALALVVLGGSLVLLDEAFGVPDVHIAEQPDPLPPIVDQPDGRVDQPDERVDEPDENPPDARDWEALPAGPLDARQDPFVAALEDGRIVVAGGSMPYSARSRTDGAVLSADRTSWTPLPDAPLAGRLVQFTVRGSTLWARKAPHPGDPAFADFAQLAQLDLDAPTKGWDELPTPPVDGVLEPTVTVYDDTVVVFGATIATAPGDPADVSVGGGAVSRDGTWTPFGAPPRPVTAGLIGVDEDHIAVVGGQTDGEVIADTAILDLATATWRAADPMPAGPRIHTDPAASTIVVDGRMFVAGGFADPIVPIAPAEHGPQHGGPTPCPPPAEPDCVVIYEWDRGPDETASSDVASSSLSWGGTPDVPARGAAWLDLATGTWEEVQLPIKDTVLPRAVRPDGLTTPDLLNLTPDHVTGRQWRLNAAGEFIQFHVPGLPFTDHLPSSRARIEIDGNGEPALAVATGDSWLGRPDRAVAIPDDGGGFIEATLPEPLVGVTYILIDGQLHAFGGVPYQAERDEDGRTGSELTYDIEQPLLARVLQR